MSRQSRALRMTASDVGSFVFRSPIAHRDQPANVTRRQRGGDLRKRSGNCAAHARMCIEQEQNRGAARFSDTGERQGTGQGAAGFRRHCMTAFQQRAEGHERIAAAGFDNAGECSAYVGRKRSTPVLIDALLRRGRGQRRRRGDFRLVQRSSHKGEHAPVDVSCLDPRNDIGLKLRNQLGSVRIASIGAVA